MSQRGLTENNDGTLLDSLVSLTSQREQEMLEHSLLSTLMDLIKVEKIELFACHWVNNVPFVRLRFSAWVEQGEIRVEETSHASWQPPPTSIEHLMEFPDQFKTKFSDQQSVYWPLYCIGKMVSLLIIHTPSVSSGNESIIRSLAHIHENFLCLLFEADRDMLTSLNNRRKFDLRFFNLMALLQEHHDAKPCTLALLDIDHFKRINDGFGHVVGDEALLLLARLMQQTLREEDGLYRYGGEEFAIIFPGLSTAEAGVDLEKFRTVVETFPFPQVGKVTVSIGYTQIKPGLLPAQLVEQADKALYYAKSHGRNQCCCYDDLVKAGELVEVEEQGGDIDLF